MRPVIVVVLAVAGGAGVPFSGHGAPALKPRVTPKSEADRLQGTWVLVSREENGRAVPAPDDTTTFTVSGGEWVWRHGHAVVTTGTFKLTDVARDPKQAIPFWTRMQEGGGSRPPEFLSTHPDPDNRIQRIRNYINQQGWGPV